MRECIYCRTTKPISDFSLEHVIPQFLGGTLTPDFLKTHDVCKKCNNNLGLFVDAQFNKDWLVSNKLATLYSNFHLPNSKTAHPLVYVGKLDFPLPAMSVNEICESWIGPNGDQVFWIKELDERFITYTGSNPIKNKSQKSTMYHLFSETIQISPEHTWTSLNSFEEFYKGKKIRKISCTTIIDQSTNQTIQLFYDIPDEVDTLRIEFIQNLPKDITHEARFTKDINSSYRFMAKLALGVSFCLLGTEGINKQYSTELYKALWFKEGDNPSDFQGISNLSKIQIPDELKILLSNTGAITIAIMQVDNDLILHLNIDTDHWTVKAADMTNVTILPEHLQNSGHGFVLIIYPAINKAIYREFAQYIQYKLGATDPELDAINEKIIK